MVEGIRKALVLGLALIAGTPIEQAPSVGSFLVRKPELDAPSLQSIGQHLQTSMEVWVANNNTSICQMRDLPLGGSTTCRRESEKIYFVDVSQWSIV